MPERERKREVLPSTPLVLSLSQGTDTGSKCSSQARQAATDDDSGDEDDAYECNASGIVFLRLPFFMHALHALRSKERERRRRSALSRISS